MKRTKIVCTIGPASRDKDVLTKLAAAGMDVARMNFSHGSHDDHRLTYQRVREVAEETGKELAILQDLQGPKIRVGLLEGDSMVLETGQTVRIAPAEKQTKPDVIPTTYDALPRDVKRGDSILMDDGLLRMTVTGVEGDEVICIVNVGGRLKNRKGINLPGVKVSAPALTEKDLADLDFGLELGVDFISLSFVRSADDITLAKERIRAAGQEIPIIAKIEKPEAVENLAAILDASDGIMVARGDLGVEMGPEKVPLIQKRAIEAANDRGKMVITATQMLESMIESAFPTRAEASDVANAVLDQSDAVMLSGETAAGKHPVLVVETMARIICEIERSARYRLLADLTPVQIDNLDNAVAHAAAAAVKSLPAIKAVACVSSHGGTPALLSDYRPQVPIYAFTEDIRLRRRLAAFWGVVPFPFERGTTSIETVARVEAALIERKLVKKGDRIIITFLIPYDSPDHTNAMKIHLIGS